MFSPADQHLLDSVLLHMNAHGEDKTRALLRQELERLNVLDVLRENKRRAVDAEREAGKLRANLEKMVTVLEFYAQRSIYAQPEVDGYHPILRDSGRRAREILESLKMREGIGA